MKNCSKKMQAELKLNRINLELQKAFKSENCLRNPVARGHGLIPMLLRGASQWGVSNIL
jgi:hypothetical protein